MLIGHSLADETGRLLAVDSHICEIMQREERELIGVKFEALTHPDDRRFNVAAVMQLGVGDAPLSIKKRYIKPDGTAVWSKVQVSRLKADDGSKLVGTIELVPSSLTCDPETLWRSAKRVTAFTERRRDELGAELFSDHAWMILLCSYLAEAEGRRISVDEVATCAKIGSSLARRWMNVLEQKGLIERLDRIDLSPQLSSLGIAKVERLLAYDINF
jgi:PAS domain S-box-containing protein